MSMLTRRLQILLDEDRYARIAEQASQRGVAVAVIVREAIDMAIPSRATERADAGRAILGAERMSVPDDPADLRREIDATRSRFG